MILWPHSLIITDRPALHAAPTQNVKARQAAATGNDNPKKVDCGISRARLVRGMNKDRTHPACREKID
jgi:hypothetical protein